MSEYVVQTQFDLIWIIIAASMVMFMQAGFTALESGLTQAKNTINVAIKNITDFMVAILVFWLLGYALMFGESLYGFMGKPSHLDDEADATTYTYFVFQAVFAGTAATIVSGAVAERMLFLSYVIIAVLVVAFIYPISGHWIWNADGWLATMGFMDFAGSTVVHSLGAWIGLAGALVVGPRINRFTEEGKVNTIQGHNLVLAVIGVLIIWFGWFGFNGGSTLAADETVPRIIANTVVAAAAGSMACFISSLCFHDQNMVSVEKLLNGIIGGLVAITAGANVVSTSGALMIGASAGVIVYFSENFLLYKCKIDDPVNVVSAHGVAGAYGTLVIPFFAVYGINKDSVMDQFWVQLIGVVSVFAWGFILGFLIFGFLKLIGKLRVTPQEEIDGLNVSEHGATTPILDMQKVMTKIVKEGDLTYRVSVAAGSEFAPLGQVFNAFMDDYEKAIGHLQCNAVALAEFSDKIDGLGHCLHETSAEYINQNEDVSKHIITLVDAVRRLNENMQGSQEYVDNAAKTASSSSQTATSTTSEIEKFVDLVKEMREKIVEVSQDTQQIGEILQTIETVSEKTNLLALNAAIEAARAGDSGRSFAVVADEVRNLSLATKEHATEIHQYLAVLKQKVSAATDVASATMKLADGSVDAVKESCTAFQTISDAVAKIHAASQGMSDLASNQYTVVDQVQSGVDNMTRVVEENRHDVEAVHNLSQQLNGLSHTLSDEILRYKVNSSTIH